MMPDFHTISRGTSKHQLSSHEIYSQRKGIAIGQFAARRDAASLQIMHCMVNENTPSHLQTLKPKLYSDVHGASIRNATSKTND